ncbi:hypothetical protein [Streptomyces sp. R41]|uniref:Secreted protein n=1 Tax=Streptomyces sp. R41 TaxID=3238632 RepID=A0AB39RFS0_9ACTN
MNKTLRVITLTAATLGAFVVAPTSASAKPTTCTVDDHYDTPGWAKSFCSGGSGYQRVVIGCKGSPTSSWTNIYRGAWKPKNEWSKVACTTDYPYLSDAYIDKKD